MPDLKFENANALYIHLPFCTSKCPYCDFYSVKYSKQRVDLYWAALFMELEELTHKVNNHLLQTIYLGGGTPSLVAPFFIGELIKKIKNKFRVIPAAEITIEINPASITEEKIIALKRAGINRLSVGIQSFNDQHLNFLGRRSSSENNKKILTLVDQYFDSYSADLIFALPEQSLKEFEIDLEEMLKFNPPHISLYNLEIHENTPFYQRYNQGELKLPTEEVDAEMYELALKKLKTAGYQHYEISNFARRGYRARHNYIYWLYQPYLALGPGAAAFDGNCRSQNLSDLSLYLKYYNPQNLSFAEFLESEVSQPAGRFRQNKQNQEIKIRELNCLSKKEKMAEYSFLALRTAKGLFYHKFYCQFKVDFKSLYKEEIAELKENNLIEEGNERIYLTDRGKEVANKVFLKFLLD
ncbi:oxygen-independent coproporphyrinogen-3 oxidase [Halanaerobium saccharolyticum]|uniref:Heme chaperone HemW n=1 Tax=Halanaerobium saccharolyticum TaxID=43595 RepID=A0A4R6LLU2_9FIRM|nr:radical SAM family heme chaperone HemW [Halanaerobium saccharolyticum]TDO85461.1 oxygen-independent coproporphyrinogen-3 oxidase [Halanaerobium saccharolyticum]